MTLSEFANLGEIFGGLGVVITLIFLILEIKNNARENQIREATDVSLFRGDALKQIATAVSEINTHNTSIASAAEEQANVARDVDRNLVSIRDLSNSTASGAEQTSASSQELSRLAVDLNNLVERFKV